MIFISFFGKCYVRVCLQAYIYTTGQVIVFVCVRLMYMYLLDIFHSLLLFMIYNIFIFRHIITIAYNHIHAAHIFHHIYKSLAAHMGHF